MSQFIIGTLRKEMQDWIKIAKVQTKKAMKKEALSVSNGIKHCLNDFIVGFNWEQMVEALQQYEGNFADGYEIAMDCIDDCLEEIKVKNGFKDIEEKEEF